MIKTLSNNKWLQYYLPVTFTLFMLVTEKRTVITDGGYDRLYGFPFPYISNNYACTGCYDVYLSALLVDLLIYVFFILLIFKMVEKLGLTLKTNWIPTVIGLLICVMWICFFCLMTEDSTFKLINDIPYNTTSREITIYQSR
ncbi:MAG: hypothetical protein NVSMB24_29520 [Mucilaginibacter sp.]